MVFAIHQHESAIDNTCPLPPRLPNSLPFPPLLVVTDHWLWVPWPYSKLPLALYFAYGNVYISVLKRDIF